MARQVKQRIDFGDTDTFRSISDLHDLISCADFPFLNHTAIQAWSLLRNKQLIRRMSSCYEGEKTMKPSDSTKVIQGDEQSRDGHYRVKHTRTGPSKSGTLPQSAPRSGSVTLFAGRKRRDRDRPEVRNSSLQQKRLEAHVAAR
jgi:hypothetical protein